MRSRKRRFERAGLAGALACLCLPALAQEVPLRVAQTASITYPLLTERAGRVNGGFLYELGERLAAQMGTRAEHLLLARRRVEPAILSGLAHIACYSSPQWSPQIPPQAWSVPVLPQIEWVLGPVGQGTPGHTPEALAGRRVAVLLGYQFPSLQPLFDAGRLLRVNDTRADNLFRLVRRGLADVLILSEAEIEGRFKKEPEERAQFSRSAQPYSVVQTHCMVSPHSPWSLAQVDAALTTLLARGEIARLAARYGMSMH